jgi:hypothetical protein
MFSRIRSFVGERFSEKQQRGYSMGTQDAWHILGTVLLSAFLGVVGQLIRVIAGLKKESDQASAAGQTLSSRFSTQQLVTSLLLSIAVGAIAGVLYGLQVTKFDSSGIVALIGAGYAGTDFIEAFMKRALPDGGSTTTPAAAPAQPTNQSPSGNPGSVISTPNPNQNQEASMAACVTTVDFTGPFPVIRVPSAKLPVTCKLSNPPTGVQIVAVKLTVTAGGAASPTITSPDGQSFVIPALPSGTSAILGVSLAGNLNGSVVHVVESCDKQTSILEIGDPNEKSAARELEVG